ARGLLAPHAVPGSGRRLGVKRPRTARSVRRGQRPGAGHGAGQPPRHGGLRVLRAWARVASRGALLSRRGRQPHPPAGHVRGRPCPAPGGTRRPDGPRRAPPSGHRAGAAPAGRADGDDAARPAAPRPAGLLPPRRAGVPPVGLRRGRAASRPRDHDQQPRARADRRDGRDRRRPRRVGAAGRGHRQVQPEPHRRRPCAGRAAAATVRGLPGKPLAPQEPRPAGRGAGQGTRSRAAARAHGADLRAARGSARSGQAGRRGRSDH
ncbi:MAG: hypothetical protein AVDCRST_MAG88-3952, partial [uncultured Thermomicrobiales bacterium]